MCVQCVCWGVMLCCVLCCAVLCCAVLCCAVLCCAVLCCASVSHSLTLWTMWLSPGLAGDSLCAAEQCPTISMATKKSKIVGNIILSASSFVSAISACGSLWSPPFG